MVFKQISEILILLPNNILLNRFKLYLFEEEKSDNTMEKYMRDGYADVLQDRKKHVLNYQMYTRYKCTGGELNE